MPAYNNDMLHCAQHTCTMRGLCYRYWLGENFRNTSFAFASYFRPKESVVDGCEHFLDKKNY